MEEKLENLLRDAYQEGFYKARDRYVIIGAQCRQSFFDSSAIMERFKALMEEMRESE